MTDNKIIIDGKIFNRCDGCPLYDGDICTGARLDEETSEKDTNICNEHLAEQFWVVWRQLKRKEQECEELETMVAEAKEAPICFHCSEEPCIRQERDKYKQALDEIMKNIKAINNECFYGDIYECNNCDMRNGCSYYRKFKILDIINKAKEQK